MTAIISDIDTIHLLFIILTEKCPLKKRHKIMVNGDKKKSLR